MAFNTNTASAVTTKDDSWKASGFINFYMTGKDGEPRKVGAIALKDSKPKEKELLEWLLADPANVQKFMNRLSIDVQSAAPAEGSGFDLS